MLRVIAVTLLTIIGVILAHALLAGLLILLAYGLGLGLAAILPFSPFQTTLLSLFSLGLVALVAARLLQAILTRSFPLAPDEDEDDEDDEEEDEDDEEEDEEDEAEDEEEEAEKPNLYPGIPRWRQPTRQLDFTGVGPDDRCPCGSGRKFKNCHGRNWKRKLPAS